MFYLAQTAPLHKIIRMKIAFSGLHKECAMSFVAAALGSVPVVSMPILIRAMDEPPPACFSREELDYTWQYLIDHQFLRPVTVIEYQDQGDLYICPHNATGTDHKHRKHLCRTCRKELREKIVDGELIALTAEEAARTLGEPIHWPDELQSEDFVS